MKKSDKFTGPQFGKVDFNFFSCPEHFQQAQISILLSTNPNMCYKGPESYSVYAYLLLWL